MKEHVLGIYLSRRVFHCIYTLYENTLNNSGWMIQCLAVNSPKILVNCLLAL